MTHLGSQSAGGVVRGSCQAADMQVSLKQSIAGSSGGHLPGGFYVNVLEVEIHCLLVLTQQIDHQVGSGYRLLDLFVVENVEVLHHHYLQRGLPFGQRSLKRPISAVYCNCIMLGIKVEVDFVGNPLTHRYLLQQAFPRLFKGTPPPPPEGGVGKGGGGPTILPKVWGRS
jgi:hypothetical protein